MADVYSFEIFLFFPLTFTIAAFITLLIAKGPFKFKVTFYVNLIIAICSATTVSVNKWSSFVVLVNLEKVVPLIVILAFLALLVDLALIGRKQEKAAVNEN